PARRGALTPLRPGAPADLRAARVCGAYRGRVTSTDATPHAPLLSDLTTLRVGGPARSPVRASAEAELVDAVRAADADGVPVLVLGGGSNLVVADEGFDGVVVQDVREGVRVDMVDSCGGGSFRVPAGHGWDALVEQAVAEQWIGLE